MLLGELGHLCLIITWVTAVVAVIAYIKADAPALERRWIAMARGAFVVHGLSLWAALGILAYILFSHQYQYSYAFRHSSNDLPWYFLISCLWEGQEGSFMLWAVWNVCIGATICYRSKQTEAHGMPVFMMIQVFLTSMLIGSHFTDSLRIGSSPFLLLKDTLAADPFSVDAPFTPQDGNGLNPLLQNLWMVIHPPVIFLGFALSGVPFALTVGGLWKKQLQRLVSAVGIWLIASIAVLGVGIMMGAYWAYETLNFGGYWNWDPVENAVLIPWLVLLASLHGLLLFQRKQKGLGLTVILILAGYLLVLYSTFLTRSGILENASVHAFTDLGLSGQLLLFLLFFVALAILAIGYGRKELFHKSEEPAALSLEFWMVIGVSALGMAAFQVLLPTSIPVFNQLIHAVGITYQFAPPADAVSFYGKFQVWFAMAFCLTGGLAQLLYWRKISSTRQLEGQLFFPVMGSVLVTTLIIYTQDITSPTYVLSIFSACYVASTALYILVGIVRNNHYQRMGGLLSHMGLGILLVGLVLSAGRQTVISQNLTINAPDSGLPAHSIQENLLLNRNVPKQNQAKVFSYTGRFRELMDGDLLSADHLGAVDRQTMLVLKEGTSTSGRIFKAGETIQIKPENIHYQIALTTGNKQHTLTPRMQDNPTMGYIASPHISHFWSHDVYTHITNFPDPEKQRWSEPASYQMSLGQSVTHQGLKLTLQDVKRMAARPGIDQSNQAINLEAVMTIADAHMTYEASPVFQITPTMLVRRFPEDIPALGAKVLLSEVHPETGNYEVQISTSQRDWITIKSIEFPCISLLWMGFLIMVAGMGCAWVYRIHQFQTEQRPAAPDTPDMAWPPFSQNLPTNQTVPKYENA